MRTIHDELGLTSVFVTHNFRFAQRCDRILQLDKGLLVNVPHAAVPQTRDREGSEARPGLASTFLPDTPALLPLQDGGGCEITATRKVN